MNEQLVADLKAAKTLIDTPEKWGKGEDVRHGSRNCIYTAMRCVRRRQLACLDALGFRGSTAESDAWRWNDAPERTHAEVMEAFDKAIEAASKS